MGKLRLRWSPVGVYAGLPTSKEVFYSRGGRYRAHLAVDWVETLAPIQFRRVAVVV